VLDSVTNARAPCEPRRHVGICRVLHRVVNRALDGEVLRYSFTPSGEARHSVPLLLQIAIMIAVQPSGTTSDAASLNTDLTVVNLSGREWTDRMKRLAARAPGLVIFGQGLVILEPAGGASLRPAGRFWKPLRSPPVPSNLDRVLESFRLIVPALRFKTSANDACGNLPDCHRQ
jgi:hypothetical protein